MGTMSTNEVRSATLMVNEKEGWVQSLEYRIVGCNEDAVREVKTTTHSIVGEETVAKIIAWFDDRYPGMVHVFNCTRVER